MSHVSVRPFSDDDYEALCAIHGAVYPDVPWDAHTRRARDGMWDPERYRRVRLVADDPALGLLAWAELRHLPWRFHPDHYDGQLEVRPEHRRQGLGSALLAHLEQQLHAWDAELVRFDAQESHTHSVAFLARRGFGEVQRHWESRLDPRVVDLAAFASAVPRVEAQGIRLTTFAEQAPRDPHLTRRIYDLWCLGDRDVPDVEPITTAPYDDWLKHIFAEDQFRPEAFFLALDGAQYVGLSMLNTYRARPDVLWQGFTCIHPAYRGRGIAMALKVRTVEHARAHPEIAEIRTLNNSRNQPMLRINEALGFVKQPAWLLFERRRG